MRRSIENLKNTIIVLQIQISGDKHFKIIYQDNTIATKLEGMYYCVKSHKKRLIRESLNTPLGRKY
jgi:hypothetical protein